MPLSTNHTFNRSTFPAPPLAIALAALGAAWLLLLVYDVLHGYQNATPAHFNFWRLVIPLGGFLPAAFRLLRPEDIHDDASAYRSFAKVTAIAASAVTFMGILALLPFTYTEAGAPAGPGSLFLGRLEELIAFVALALLAEESLRLFRYRQKRTLPKLATWFAWALLAIFLVGTLLGRLAEELPTPIHIASAVTAITALFLSSRMQWVVNLRRGQKWLVLAFSIAGMIAAGCMYGLLDSDNVSNAILSGSAGLNAMLEPVITAFLFLELSCFFQALIALPTATAFDRRNTEVASLHTFGRLMTESFSMQELMDASVQIAAEVTGGGIAWIELFVPTTESGNTASANIPALIQQEPETTLYCNPNQQLPIPVAAELMQTFHHETSLAKAVENSRNVEVVDRMEPVRWKRGDGPVQVVGTVAAAPLCSGDSLLGILYVARPKAHDFDRRDLATLKTISGQIALALEHARLFQVSVEQGRLEQEMLIARELQQRLLPRSMPESPWFELYAESEPASHVGGDYYDVVSFSDGTLGLLIADVAGKGASAALYMGMIKGIIQALSGSCNGPKELLAKINVALYGQGDQRWFATMTCAQVLEEQRTLRIARAGHCPTLLIKNGEASYSRSKGLGLAIARPIFFEKNLEIEEHSFAPGEYVVLLSDGFPEARSPQGDEFGYDRLLAVAEGTAKTAATARAMRDGIAGAIADFSQGEPAADDSTIMVLRWR